MKYNIEEINVLIKETLTKKELESYNQLEQQNMLGMFASLFNGKNKGIMIMMNIMIIVFFVLFVYCLIQFFKVDAIKDLLKWGLGSIVFLLGVSMLKVFIWMQMDKNAILREVKRLQLQIAFLSRK